jgi:hypothetical protein
VPVKRMSDELVLTFSPVQAHPSGRRAMSDKVPRPDAVSQCSENGNCLMTPTPPLGDEEAARRLPIWPLDERRTDDGRTPFGCLSDIVRMSARTPHDCRQADGDDAPGLTECCTHPRRSRNYTPAHGWSHLFTPTATGRHRCCDVAGAAALCCQYLARCAVLHIDSGGRSGRAGL